MYSTVYDDVINDINTELRVLKKTQPSRAAHIKKLYRWVGVFPFFSNFLPLKSVRSQGTRYLFFDKKKKIENWQIYGQAYICMT